MDLNHTAAMLSPGLKTLVFPTETRSQAFQLEVRGTKSIVYGQYMAVVRIKTIVIEIKKIYYSTRAVYTKTIIQFSFSESG